MLLKILEICDNNKRYYNQQKPGRDLLYTNHMPFVYLSWILPSAVECRNIFSNPNKESNK